MLRVRENSPYARRFPSEIKTWKYAIEKTAEMMGLPHVPVIYEVVTAREMAALASYWGMPSRYSHWSWGMQYDRNLKESLWHKGGILEMVCTTKPMVAYLQEHNSMATQKSVIAHVSAGHAPFLAHNFWTKRIYERYIDEFAAHASRISRYAEKHGVDVVEKFLDVCLSISTLIDINATYLKARPKKLHKWANEEKEHPARLSTKSYMDSFVNRYDWMEEQEKNIEEEKKQKKKVLSHPEKDIMLFLINHAPLEAWQLDIMSIVREEAYYFAPIARTKTIDEGASAYFQSLVMTGSDAVNPYREKIYSDGKVPPPIMDMKECVAYAEEMAAVVLNRGYNPYLVGRTIFLDIEERWNKGRFGEEWDECKDRHERKHWDKKLGLGREKVHEVWRQCNDVSFIDQYLTQESVDKLKLFAWKRDGKEVKIKSRELPDVRRALLYRIMNMGYPTVEAVEVEPTGNLKLYHKHDGVGLDSNRAKEVLKRIAEHVWKKEVYLETRNSKGNKEVWFQKPS
jgi:stage V sporulation protein R